MRVRLLYLPPNKIYSVHAFSHCRFIPRVLSYTAKHLVGVTEKR
ncbi:hypothetical protein [Escherichia phage vB_EcoM_ULIM8]|nr:hypothetical protein [Escherichia phage vB_EcoM_ULIM8]